MGERHFKKARQKQEKELGKDFDIKRFHYLVLNCPGPLEMLEECMQQKSGLQTSKPKSKSSAKVVSPGYVALLLAMLIARVFVWNYQIPFTETYTFKINTFDAIDLILFKQTSLT